MFNKTSIKTRLKKFACMLTLLMGISLAASPGLAVAATVTNVGLASKGAACQTLNNLNGQSGGCGDSSGVTGIFHAVVSILSIVVGVASVIMVIVGGFKFITSSGDSQKAASARSTIVYALIGVAVAALAQVLVHFVLFQTNKAAGG